MARPVQFNKRNRTPESEFRSACLKWLKIRFGKYFWHARISGGPLQRPGLPDDLCSIRGHFVALEFKDPGGSGRIGPRQAEVLAEIIAAGARAHVISCWDDLDEAVAEFAPVQLGMSERKLGGLPHD